MEDFPYVEWLARLYKKVGEFSGSWTDYIKVSLLSHFIIIISKNMLLFTVITFCVIDAILGTHC